MYVYELQRGTSKVDLIKQVVQSALQVYTGIYSQVFLYPIKFQRVLHTIEITVK